MKKFMISIVPHIRLTPSIGILHREFTWLQAQSYVTYDSFVHAVLGKKIHSV